MNDIDKSELEKLRDTFFELSAAQLEEFGVPRGYSSNMLAVLIWKKLEPAIKKQCNQARIDELQALRAGRSYKVGADYRIIPPKGDVRLFYDEFDIDGRIAELQAKETEETHGH